MLRHGLCGDIVYANARSCVCVSEGRNQEFEVKKCSPAPTTDTRS